MRNTEIRSRPGRPGWLLLLVALAAVGCGDGGRPDVGRVLAGFMEAVQDGDIDSLFCLCGGAAGSPELGPDAATRREAFERWALQGYEAYLDGRDRGEVHLDGSGIALVQLFQLGRGTFYSIVAAAPVGEDGYRLRTSLRFGYDKVDLSRLSAGTTFYVSGVPAGTIHAARIPAGEGEVSVDALDTIEVEWSLLRADEADGCGRRWTVATVAPVAGSESSREINWVF